MSNQAVRAGKNYLDLVREYFPGISDDEADYILWERTGFPTFFDDATVGAGLRRQLAELREGE